MKSLPASIFWDVLLETISLTRLSICLHCNFLAFNLHIDVFKFFGKKTIVDDCLLLAVIGETWLKAGPPFLLGYLQCNWQAYFYATEVYLIYNIEMYNACLFSIIFGRLLYIHLDYNYMRILHVMCLHICSFTFVFYYSQLC